MALVTRYVNDASTSGGDGTTNDTTGANRAYVSLTAWDAAEQGNLVTDTNQHIVYLTGTDTWDGSFNGWTFNTTYTLTVQAHDDDICDVTAATGAKWASVGANSAFLTPWDSGLFVKRIFLDGNVSGMSGFAYANGTVIYEQCRIDMPYAYQASNLTCKCCLIIVSGTATTTGGGSPKDCGLQNCTIVSTASGKGMYNGDMMVWSDDSYNTVCYNKTTKGTYDTYYSSDSGDYNGLNDNGSTMTCPPGTNDTEVVSGDFEDVDTEDMHLTAGSACIGAGDDTFSPTYTVDADGVAFDDPMPIGCFEYVAAGGSIIPQIMHHRRSLTG